MKNYLHCCFLLLFIVCLVDSNFRNDYTYYKDAEGYLKFHKMPANWREARLRCHLEGAKLASPLNSELKYSMEAIVKDKCPDCPIFTGIHATFSKGDYFSVEGVPLSSIPERWFKNESDYTRDRGNCIQMTAEGDLVVVVCSETFPYVCYKKAQFMVMNNCGTVDSEYSLDSRTGSCYKFHRVPRTWSRSYMACAAEGGYLAIINSATEAQVIKEIYAKNPGSTMIGKFYKDVAFIGFHDWNERGEWLTIKGETLQEAGYYQFATGQPDNATFGESCGSVFRSGKLNDLWCEDVHAFICEKDPTSLTSAPFESQEQQ